MALFNKVIPSFMGGVSQQPHTLRLADQCELLEDAYPSLVHGLMKRPGTEIVAELTSNADSSTRIHLIDRDSGEQYIVLFTGDATTPIEVYTLTGAAATVQYGDIGAEVSLYSPSGYSDSTTTRLGYDWFLYLQDYEDHMIIIENTSGVSWDVGKIKFYCTYKGSADNSAEIYIRVQDEDGSGYGDGTDDANATITFGDLKVGENIVELDTVKTVANGAKIAIIFDVEWFNSVPSLIQYFDLRTSSDGEEYRKRISDADGGGTSGWSDEATESPMWVELYEASFTADATYKEYVTTPDPEQNLSASTIADTTVIANAALTPAMSTTTSTAQANEYLLYFKGAGTASHDGWMYLDSTLVEDDADGKTFSGQSSSRNAANATATEIAGWDTGGLYTVTAVGTNILHITRVNGAAFTCTFEDTYGDQAVIVIGHEVQKFSDLPPYAKDGYIVKVTGTGEDKFNSFYAKFEQGDSQGTGTWKETIAPGVEYTFDSTTMPYKMVRTAANTFTVSPCAWTDRLVGDSDTAPDPTFVGEPIRNVFFYKNRLGFLAGENVILSKTSDFFDFFPSTTLDILDDDPIDIAIDTSDVSILRHAVPFNEQLLLFSDDTQFVMSGGGGPVTPTSVTVDTSTRFVMDKDTPPVRVGTNVYFSVPKGESTTIREYFVQTDSVTNDAADITSHVPKYLDNGVSILEGSSSMEFLVAAVKGESTVWFYKYQWSGEEKVQSAWCKWNMPYNVLGMKVLRNNIYIVSTDGTNVWLEKLNTEKVTDTGLSWRVHLDRKELLQGVESGGTTTFTLSYTDGANDFVAVDSVTGTIYDLVDASTTTKTYVGDISTNECYVGRKYTMRYTFSEFGVPQENSNILSSLGRLQMRRLTVGCKDTGYIKVECTPEGRTQFDREFTDSTLYTGPRRFLINSHATGLTVDMVNDTVYPCQLMTGAWEGTYSRQGSRSIG